MNGRYTSLALAAALMASGALAALVHEGGEAAAQANPEEGSPGGANSTGWENGPGSMLMEPYMTERSPSEIYLVWSCCYEPDFQSYRIYRNTTSMVDRSSQLLFQIDDRNRTSEFDRMVDAGTTYYYLIEVVYTDGSWLDGNVVFATPGEPYSQPAVFGLKVPLGSGRNIPGMRDQGAELAVIGGDWQTNAVFMRLMGWKFGGPVHTVLANLTQGGMMPVDFDMDGMEDLKLKFINVEYARCTLPNGTTHGQYPMFDFEITDQSALDDENKPGDVDGGGDGGGDEGGGDGIGTSASLEMDTPQSVQLDNGDDFTAKVTGYDNGSEKMTVELGDDRATMEPGDFALADTDGDGQNDLIAVFTDVDDDGRFKMEYIPLNEDRVKREFTIFYYVIIALLVAVIASIAASLAMGRRGKTAK